MLRLTSTQADSDPLEATFELNDTLYSKANISASEDVYLWLGANVMLSYPVGEAEELLEQKLSAAQQSRANCEDDLDFLREQITVSLPHSPKYGASANSCIADDGSGYCSSLQLGRAAKKVGEREW